jgi:hypothetical protein
MKRMLRDIDPYQIYKKWHSGAGHFSCFSRTVNFVSMKHYPDFELSEVRPEPDERYSIAERIIDSHGGKKIILIDLPAIESMRISCLLNNTRRANPVITFNSPLHEFGFIGGRDYISALTGYGDHLLTMEGAGPGSCCFVLDWNRFGDYSEEELKKYFNNQYELTEEDLPPVDMLRHLGYDVLIYLHSGPREDAERYINYLTDQGFHVISEAILEES